MAEMRFEQRMSDQDALMWAIEKDPLLRSTITSVSILESSPDRERFEDQLERATRTVPRLRQRVVSAPMSADRKSTRLNSSHANISYAVFCLKKKKIE